MNGLQPPKIFAGKAIFLASLKPAAVPAWCNFCSVALQGQLQKKTDLVVEEMATGRKNVFLPMGICRRPGRARAFSHSSLKINWFSQAGLEALKDDPSHADGRSGRMGLMIGRISDRKSCTNEQKHGNHAEEYTHVIGLLRKADLRMQFIFGYPHDTPETFERA
jgi:hypothetical protein